MSNQLATIIAFCAGRYNETHSKDWLVIIDHARDLQWSSADPERDLLDWLSKPHASPELVKTCQAVIERLGAE